MTAYRFRLVNVFTQKGDALSGNPLCVFETGAGLQGDTMQALALQFNLSETTFILPGREGSAATVRIFTPSFEMPFAGHPTLGTAHVCRGLGLCGDALSLDMLAGRIAVEASGDRWSLTAPQSTWREFEWSRAELGAALGLDAGDIAERPLWVNAGKEQLIVPLAAADAVRRAAPRPDAFSKLRSADGHSMAYVFANGDSGEVLARFFFPQAGSLREDPATGSAAANLGGWCLAMGRPLPLALRVSQGAAIRRPSTIYLTVDAARRIRVGGDVREIGSGAVEIG